jgi:putative FmdB family regulatory protein
MPIYAYRCENCGVQFERYQSFKEASLKVCPECRKKTLKKVISPVGVVFKGAGFYSTDNKSGSGGNMQKPARKDESKKDENKKDEPKKEETKKEETKKSEPVESKTSAKSEKTE